MGVRKVLGGSRSTLITAYLGETALMTGAASILALLIVPTALGYFESFLPPGLPFQLNGQVLGFLGLTGAATTLLAGLYPAFALSAFSPAQVLKGQAMARTGEKGYLRKSLIVFQFVVSVVFILE